MIDTDLRGQIDEVRALVGRARFQARVYAFNETHRHAARTHFDKIDAALDRLERSSYALDVMFAAAVDGACTCLCFVVPSATRRGREPNNHIDSCPYRSEFERLSHRLEAGEWPFEVYEPPVYKPVYPDRAIVRRAAS